ncbi:MAG: carbonate dehydratase, partial [Burkholderiales bacterium PBB4]
MGLLSTAPGWANETKAPPDKPTAKADIEATTASNPKDVASKVREALGGNVIPNKKLMVTVAAKPGEKPAVESGHDGHAAPAITAANRRAIQARAAALTGPAIAATSATHAAAGHGGEAHWSYEGDTGPQAWGSMKPEFNLCAIGKRQSPISIEEGSTLQGPAEPILFSYTPSSATVVNNGHTIQVDVVGDNSIKVRGSNYRLLQFHFHTPSEEQINFKRYPMVAHLVHKNGDGQLAVVAVLLDTGAANALIEKVWTYMPLDTGDRVRMPADLLQLEELLPKDQRYYQFMGSLTTPPCSEGVLWMVLKTPMTISKAQLKLFTQLYPNNARPVQPVNAR